MGAKLHHAGVGSLACEGRLAREAHERLQIIIHDPFTHETTDALAEFQHALDHEMRQRLVGRGPTHTKSFADFPFGEELLARLEFTPADQALKQIIELPIDRVPNQLTRGGCDGWKSRWHSHRVAKSSDRVCQTAFLSYSCSGIS